MALRRREGTVKLTLRRQKSTRSLDLSRIPPAHGRVNAARRDNTTLKEMALQVASGDLRSIRILYFHPRIVFGMSIWVPVVKLAPFISHRLILAPIDVSHRVEASSISVLFEGSKVTRRNGARRFRHLAALSTRTTLMTSPILRVNWHGECCQV